MKTALCAFAQGLLFKGEGADSSHPRSAQNRLRF